MTTSFSLPVTRRRDAARNGSFDVFAVRALLQGDRPLDSVIVRRSSQPLCRSFGVDTVAHMAEILVEVTPSPGDRGDLRTRSVVPEDFRQRALELADSIVDVAAGLRERFEVAAAGDERGRLRLDEIGVKFGIALQAEAGVVIARASAGATFEATLHWKSASQ
jgi:hypothetical protein